MANGKIRPATCHLPHFICSVLPPAGSYWQPLPAALPMPSDSDLLRRYADQRDEAAFAEVVRRHVDLAYATALRVLHGDTHLAQDAALHLPLKRGN